MTILAIKRARIMGVALAATALIGGVAACSDDNNSSSGSSSTATTTGAPTTTAQAPTSGAATTTPEMSGMPGMSGTTGSGDTTAPATGAPNTAIVTSTSVTSVSGTAIEITDPAILACYGGRGYEKGYLGKPLGPVVDLSKGGKFITFENGSCYLNPALNKAFAMHGAIGDYWGTKNHELGALGYPTGDETKIAGGLSQTFDGGTLEFVNGTVTQK